VAHRAEKPQPRSAAWHTGKKVIGENAGPFSSTAQNSLSCMPKVAKGKGGSTNSFHKFTGHKTCCIHEWSILSK
jgi:hypothetical protein